MVISPHGQLPYRVSFMQGFLASACGKLGAFALLALLPLGYVAIELLACHGQLTVVPSVEQRLSDVVSSEAAKHAVDAGTGGEGLGVLAILGREPSTWGMGLLAWIARWSPWLWSNTSCWVGLTILAALLLVVRFFALSASAHFASLAAISAAQLLRRDLYQHTFRLNALATQPEQQQIAGELMTDAVDRVSDGWVATWTQLPRFSTLLLGSLLLLLLVNLWLGVAALFLGAVVWLLVGQLTASFRRDARHAERQGTANRLVIRESLRFLLVVKCYLMDRFSQNRMERHLADLQLLSTRQARGETLAKPLLGLAVALAGVVLCLFFGLGVLHGNHTLGGLAVLLGASTIVCTAVLRLLAVRSKWNRAKDASLELQEFFARRTDAGQDIDAKFLQPLAQQLELKGVSYRESGTGTMLLENLTLSIPAKARTAIVCSDPDEARALAFLLMRFLEPTAGEIRIDGTNIRWVTFESLRTQVAMVLPDNTTFSDTVANNMSCGDPTFTLPKVVDAAKLAHAHNFIQSLPNGYETVIGDVGYHLSPGQCYRIALARALLRDPAVLILEEPREPFDADSTAMIDDTLSRLANQMTIIQFAQRSATLQRADRVFAIQSGKLTATQSNDLQISGSAVARALVEANKS
jgi:ABC-type multidrug transport system fused ATPase/permease subunit